MPFPIAVPLKPSLYLQQVFEIFGFKVQNPRARTDKCTDTRRKWFYVSCNVLYWTDNISCR